MLNNIYCLIILLGFQSVVRMENIIIRDLEPFLDRNALTYQTISRSGKVIYPNTADCATLLATKNHSLITNYLPRHENCDQIDTEDITGFYVTFFDKGTSKACVMSILSKIHSNSLVIYVTKYNFVDKTWVPFNDYGLFGSVSLDDGADLDSVCNSNAEMGKFCFLNVDKNLEFINNISRIECNYRLIKEDKIKISELKDDFPVVWRFVDASHDTSKTSRLIENPCKFKKNCKTETIRSEGLHIYANSNFNSKLGELVGFTNNFRQIIKNDPLEFSNYVCRDEKNKSHVHVHRGFSGEQSALYTHVDLTDCIQGKCKGDSLYCKNFGCASVINHYCYFVTNSYPLEFVTSEGEIIHPGGVVRRDGFPSIELNEHGKKTITDGMDSIIKCENGKFEFESKFHEFTYLEICKFPLCLKKNDSKSNHLIVELPRSLTLKSGVARIRVKFSENDHVIELNTYCESSGFCDRYFGILSYDQWLHPSCYTAGQYTIIVFGVFIGLCVLYPLILLISKFITVLIMFCLPSFKYIYKSLQWFVAKCMGFIREIKRNHDQRIGVAIDIEEQRPLRARNAPRNPLANRYRMQFLTILTIVCLISSTEGCSKITTLIIEQNQCTVSATGTETCNIITTGRIAVSPVGQTSCFILEKNGRPFGSIQIKTNSISLDCVKNDLYYIPDIKSGCSSVYNCQGAGFCDADFKQCNHPEKFTKEIFGSSPALSWHKCEIIASGSGCFYNKACFHVQKKFQLRSRNFVRAYDCSNWRYSASLTISKSTIDNVQTKEIILTAGIEDSIYDVSFNLISITVPPSGLFNKCFLNRNKIWSISECNRRGEIVMNKIGEIQCPSENSVISGNFEGCITNEDSIKVERRNEYASCSFIGLEIEKFFENILPTTYGDFFVDIRNNVPFIKIHHEAVLEIQLDVKGMKIISTSDQNMCYAKFKKISGCYSCPLGSEVELELNTNFGSANGIIECPQYKIKFPVNVEKDPNNKNYTIHFDEAYIDTTCVIICPAGKKEFIIKGELHYIPISEIHSNDSTTGIVIGNSGSIDWKNILKLPFFGWFMYSIVFIIFLFVFTLLLGKIASKLFLTKKNK